MIAPKGRTKSEVGILLFMLKRFLSDSLIYSIPTVISRGLSVILVPLYTRVLSPSDYGSLELLTVFASIVNLTIALEVSQGVARFYASEPDPDRKVVYASSAFWFTVVCYSIFSALMLFLSPDVASLVMGRDGLVREFHAGIAYIWINGILYLVQNQLRWELRSRQYAIVSLVMTVATALFSVCLAYFLRWGLMGLLLGMTAGCLMATALGLSWLRQSFTLRFSMIQLWEMLRFSIPLVLSSIAIWLSLYIDRIMINHLLSVEELGLYSMGYRLSSVAGLIMVGFQSSLTPLIYTYYRDPETPSQIARIFRLFLFFALCVFLMLGMFSSDILRILTTPAFYEGSDVVVFLVPAFFLANMYIFAPGISIAKKTEVFVWINIFGAIINIILNYLLIPIFGIRGAAFATMMGNFIAFLSNIIIGQKYYRIPYQWLRLLGAAAFSVFVVIMISILPYDQPIRWPIIILALIIFPLIAIRTGLVDHTEMMVFVELLRRQKAYYWQRYIAR